MVELDSVQQEAVEACCDLKNRIVSVTGQAGTGKTTVIKETYRRLDEMYPNEIVLCAPTGKAAKRITEVTGIPAMTIHRLLKYPKPGELCPKTGKPLLPTEPQHDRLNPIEFMVVICDEYAMVNHEVARNLLDALPRGGCIRMFGDINQLQPIENQKSMQDKPSPFMTVLERYKKVVLSHIYRQQDGSNIIYNADMIRQGRIPRRFDDFDLCITDDPVKQVKEIVRNNPIYYTTQGQIIVPTKKTWLGTVKLNVAIQMMREPSDKYVKPVRHEWAEDQGIYFGVGDKVLCTQNLYELEVFNGETGIIEDITSSNEIVVNLGDRIVVFPETIERTNKYGKVFHYCCQKDLDLAYAITTHKSQGSEYEEVIYAINKSSKFIQNRKNLYTAVTRAKKKVTLVTDQQSLTHSLFKITDYERAQLRNKPKVMGNTIEYRS